MDTPDAREQVKIWQRVRGETPPVTDGLPGLAAGALARAALYGALALQLQGPGRSILQQLQEEEQHCARCLKGIYRMATGAVMNAASVPVSADKTEAVLRKSYGQTLKALAAFDSRAYDVEFGPVFGILAAKMRTACCKLAELMSFLGV